MRLLDFINVFSVRERFGNLDVEIFDVCCVADDATKDSCFVALPGKKTHGINYVHRAIERGAKAVITDSAENLPAGIGCLVVEDPRFAMASLASMINDEPSKKIKLIGITGTSGKTTTCYLIESIAQSAGISMGVMGTVEHRFLNVVENASHTTPESCDIQRFLSKMVDSKVELCAMEVSSHALSQKRVDKTHFDCVIFTNLSREHLDYHADMENYFCAKRRLFTGIISRSEKVAKKAVINLDDPYGMRLAKEIKTEILTYGFSKEADISVENLVSGGDGIRCTLNTPVGTLQISSKLIGRHNVYNIMAAVAAALSVGISAERIVEGVASLKRVPGRMEEIDNDKGVLALVDYAHKPQALSSILAEGKRLKGEKKLILVFGCGGDRDKGKRRIMGEIAANLADHVIVTSDNPRSEDPMAIIDEIVSGIKEGMMSSMRADFSYEINEDRRDAISRAAALSKAGDVLIVAGKGHESYQLVKNEVKAFDDREELRKCLV
ncbi:MAG: UDP-N-acetylmuramoyl-L-alanyl-D-glutamate--2,6-diaminopimelate ligase [Pseudomonadota bacterium]